MGVLIRSLFFASGACVALVVFPAVAAAQQRVFADGIVELATALEGTFGDEGARIGPALDRMGNALAEWDRAIRAVGSVTSGSVAAADRSSVSALS